MGKLKKSLPSTLNQINFTRLKCLVLYN